MEKDQGQLTITIKGKEFRYKHKISLYNAGRIIEWLACEEEWLKKQKSPPRRLPQKG